MKNRNLSRSAQEAKSDVEDAIEELITEIEELESELDKANDRISELETELDKANDTISELDDIIKNHAS